MKKILLTLAVMVLMTTQAFADQSGTCGTNATWTLNEYTGVLTISGTGEMKEYDYYNNSSPFANLKSSIKQIIIREGITSIGSYAFPDCSKLTSVNIPNSVTVIGWYAFYNCTGLTSIEIPNSVTSLEYGAFYGCTGLTSVKIPNSVTTIGNYAFTGCSKLTSLDIPNSVTVIKDGAFKKCIGLTSFIIPNSVTEIGNYIFEGCTGLTAVTFGNSITSIGYGIFYDCNGLIEIVVLADKPYTVPSGAFTSSVYKNTTLRVKKGLKPLFEAAPTWGEFADIKELADDIDDKKAKYDLNEDGKVNSVDIVAIYNYIITGK